MWLRNTAMVGFAFALLVLQSAIAAHVSIHPLTPNLLLPIVMYLGVQHDVQVVRGALLSWVLGYLLDAFCGSPIGLSTFVLVATFLAARGAGIRLFLRGSPFQIALVFAVSMLAGGTVLALRAIFSPPEAFPLEMPATGMIGGFLAWLTGREPSAGNVVSTTIALVVSSIATALVSPAIFAACRRIETIRMRRRETEGAPTE
jgi:rod shape-determining protein MreD